MLEAEIEVLQPGLFSTIQDLGRFGYMKFGVPVSGAMDNFSAKMANLILNNSPNSAVLEITQTGPKLKFSSKTKIALTGADLSAAINENILKLNSAHIVNPGDILSFGKPVSGTRAYLAVAGGFQTEEILGSRSWYEGVTAHYRLQKGLKLSILAGNRFEETFSSVKMKQDHIDTMELEVYEGPEFHLLKKDELKELLNQPFSIDQNNSRMAIQLQENFPNNLEPIITGPVLPGIVQLTPLGKLIVLMKDCQTTGGYPRVLQLSSNGMDVISQKAVGKQIVFRLRYL